MFCIYLINSLIIHILDTMRYKSLFTTFNVVFGPINIIVLLNNLIAFHFGFYKISDDVLVLLFFTSILFYFFSFWSQLLFNNSFFKKRGNIKYCEITNKHISFMTFFLWLAIVVSLLRLVPMIHKYGMVLFTNEELLRLYYFNGINAHLMIASMVIFPVYYHNCTRTSHKLTMLVYLVLLFSVGVKYYVIVTLLATFFYTALDNRRSSNITINIKNTIFLVVLIVIIFYAFYLFQYYIFGLSIGFSQIMIHLWKYIAGPLIALGSQNYAFDFYTIISFVFRPFFNIYHILTNNGVEYVKTLVDYHQVHVSGSTANVTGVIGILFAAESKLLYFMLIILWSVSMNAIFYICKMNICDIRFRALLGITFAYGVLSFFSVYSTLLTFWETMIYPLVIFSILFVGLKQE